jgi:hypothetical protein
MNNIDYAFGPSSVFIYDRLNNKPIEITNDRLNYQSIIEAIRDNNEDLVRELLDENQVINNVSNGRVIVKGNTVNLDGEELHSAEAKKLLDLVSEGATNIDRWFRFIEKLHDNPSYHCREQAYNFIAHSGMPMTENGNLIGYKGVADDYKDKYSGKFDNSVGQVLSMARSKVDDNPNNGCSSGFHVGSHNYADQWAGNDGRLMIVEYNPADIVSVPDEHGYGKLRVSKYTVIAEHSSRQKLNDGGYGNMTSIDQDELFDWLDNRVSHTHDDSIPVYFREVKHAFPRVTMSDITECITNYSHYHPDYTFDSDVNDYTIRFQELPH